MNLDPKYLILVERVRDHDPAAAKYMLTGAPLLEDFVATSRLSGSFAWYDTPQGHKYWSDLNRQLGDSI